MKPSLTESPFLKACRREKTAHTPIWIMRQAGRYMKEYRDIRKRVGFLELCKTPELAAEVTIQAADILQVDAAIIFADILLVTEPMGFSLSFHEGQGPEFSNPLRTKKDVENMRSIVPTEQLDFVLDAIRLVRKDLPAHLPLIGFAGAPFTVASYLIEGKSSRHLENTKRLMRSEPDLWKNLMQKLSVATADYLQAQIEAGASAVQLFDSWIGCIDPYEYRTYVAPYVRSIFKAIPKHVPAIHFGTGTGLLLEAMAEAGGTVMGIDFLTPLDTARRRLKNMALQGNLDPTVLLSPPSVIRTETKRVLDLAGPEPGHIFNLGHGILPSTPVEHARHSVDLVHQMTSK